MKKTMVLLVSVLVGAFCFHGIRAQQQAVVGTHQILPVPRCLNSYQFTQDVIYSRTDPQIDWILTKVNSANFYLMLDAGFTNGNVVNAMDQLARLTVLIDMFYAINPRGTPLTIKYDCIPISSLSGYSSGPSNSFFGDSNFLTLDAYETPYGLGGEGTDFWDEWDYDFESDGGCWSGSVVHSSGFTLGAGGCEGDPGFALGVNQVSVGWTWSF